MKSVKKFLIGNPDIGSYVHEKSVLVMDSSATTLPADGTSMTADGVTLSHGDRVLFTNLTDATKNNSIYEVTETTGVFSLKSDALLGSGTSTPIRGTTVLVQEGTHSGELRCFDGSWELLDLDVISGPTASVPNSALTPAADVAANTAATAITIALSTSDTYTDSAVNTAVNTALGTVVTDMNATRTQINAILTALKNAGLMS